MAVKPHRREQTLEKQEQMERKEKILEMPKTMST